LLLRGEKIVDWKSGLLRRMSPWWHKADLPVIVLPGVRVGVVILPVKPNP